MDKYEIREGDSRIPDRIAQTLGMPDFINPFPNRTLTVMVNPNTPVPSFGFAITDPDDNLDVLVATESIEDIKRVRDTLTRFIEAYG